MNRNDAMHEQKDICPGYCAINQCRGTSRSAVNLGLNLVILPRQPQHRARLRPSSRQLGSSLTDWEWERKKKKNEWQAEPIKHEVECEGMYPPLFHKHLRNVHRTLFVLSMRSLILHWSASFISLFISKPLKTSLEQFAWTLKQQEGAVSVWIMIQHESHIYCSCLKIITTT